MNLHNSKSKSYKLEKYLIKYKHSSDIRYLDKVIYYLKGGIGSSLYDNVNVSPKGNLAVTNNPVSGNKPVYDLATETNPVLDNTNQYVVYDFADNNPVYDLATGTNIYNLATSNKPVSTDLGPTYSVADISSDSANNSGNSGVYCKNPCEEFEITKDILEQINKKNNPEYKKLGIKATETNQSELNKCIGSNYNEYSNYIKCKKCSLIPVKTCDKYESCISGGPVSNTPSGIEYKTCLDINTIYENPENFKVEKLDDYFCKLSTINNDLETLQSRKLPYWDKNTESCVNKKKVVYENIQFPEQIKENNKSQLNKQIKIILKGIYFTENSLITNIINVKPDITLDELKEQIFNLIKKNKKKIEAYQTQFNRYKYIDFKVFTKDYIWITIDTFGQLTDNQSINIYISKNKPNIVYPNTN